MSLTSNRAAKFASVAAILLLAGCAQPASAPQASAPPAPTPVAYNPPSASLAATPAAQIHWYQVTFTSGSSRIDAFGGDTVGKVATAMQSDPTLKVTVVGTADRVGSDATNMLLSKQRADAVHNALLRTGKVTEQRIETRWTGERPDGARPTVGGSDVSKRVVDIALHY